MVEAMAIAQALPMTVATAVARAAVMPCAKTVAVAMPMLVAMNARMHNLTANVDGSGGYSGNTKWRASGNDCARTSGDGADCVCWHC